MPDETKENEKPPRKVPGVDDFVAGAEKLFAIGEDPNDPVVKALRRFASWLKYIFISELMLCFVIGGPCYGVYKIKRGEIDELTEIVVQTADVFFEEDETPPPQINEPKETGDEIFGK